MVKVRTPATRVPGLLVAKLQPRSIPISKPHASAVATRQRLPVPAAVHDGRPPLDGQARVAFEHLLRELAAARPAPTAWRCAPRDSEAGRRRGSSLRVTGRGMQTNSVRISSPVSRTFA